MFELSNGVLIAVTKVGDLNQLVKGSVCSQASFGKVSRCKFQICLNTDSSKLSSTTSSWQGAAWNPENEKNWCLQSRRWLCEDRRSCRFEMSTTGDGDGGGHV